MMKSIRMILFALLTVFLLAVPFTSAQDDTPVTQTKNKESIAISEAMDDVMIQEVTKVKEEFSQKVRSLFDRRPLGWDLNTIAYLSRLALSLPAKLPVFTRMVIEQSRVLGAIGSILVLVFISAVLYSLLGQRRVMRKVEELVEPLSKFIPEATYPFVMSGIKVVVSALIPLLLLGAFALINAMIDYSAVWFQLVGRLLGFWAVGALLLRLLKESL